MPPVLNSIYEKFEEFYRSSQTRRLTMNTQSSHGTIQFTWMKRPIQLACKLYQMAILLLFNDHPEITFSQLGEFTKLPSDVLQVHLSGIVSKGVISCSTDKTFNPDRKVKKIF